MNQHEVMQQALDALILNNKEWKSFADSGDAGYFKAEEQPHYKTTVSAIESLSAALALPDAQPVVAPDLNERLKAAEAAYVEAVMAHNITLDELRDVLHPAIAPKE